LLKQNPTGRFTFLLLENKEKEMDVCNGRGREHEGKQRTTLLLIFTTCLITK